MAETLTTRLGLIKPVKDENTVVDVDRLNANADRLDVVSGVIHVNDNVTPPDNVLFDGALVREKQSGKLWVAHQQTNDTYAKKYTQFPWYIFAYSSGDTVGSINAWQMNQVEHFGEGVNASQLDIVDGNVNGISRKGVKIPVDGVYTGFCMVEWSNPNLANYVVGSSFSVNAPVSFTPFPAANQEVTNEIRQFGATQQHVPIAQYFNRNDIIRPVVYNNTGVAFPVETVIQLICAMPGKQTTITDT